MAVAGLFSPRSVALIGASDNPASLGGRCLRNLQSSGFSGHVLPVNPRHESLLGMPCYGRVDDIGEPVDLAILAIPAADVPAAIEACGRARVPAAIVFSAGFGEEGGDGAHVQAEVAALAAIHGVRLLGPNCLGTVDTSTGLVATFSSVLKGGALLPGTIAIISQSGAVGAYLIGLLHQRRIGFRLFASTGNESDLELAELLEYVVTMPDVSAVLCYIEEIRDARRLLAAVRAARATGKPVVVARVGKSDIGADMTASHTGALVRSRVYDEVLSQSGIVLVPGIAQMVDVATMVDAGLSAPGRRVGILSISGGAAAMLADACAETGLSIPALDAPTEMTLRDIPFATTRNPIDFTAQILARSELYGRYLGALARSADIDLIILFIGEVLDLDPGVSRRVVDTTIEMRQTSGKPIIIVGIVEAEDTAARLAGAGIPVFPDPREAVLAIASLARRGRPAQSAPRPTPVIAREHAADRFVRQDVRRVLSQSGLDFAPARTVITGIGAVLAAREIGFPVAMKVVSAQIPHKADVDGVRLGVRSEDEVLAGFDALLANVRARAPDVAVDGIQIQKMVTGGIELLVALRDDPVFGPAVVCGFGGLYTELVNDVAVRLAPVSEAEAVGMLRDLRLFGLLDGARGQGRFDVGAVARTVSSMSKAFPLLPEGVAEVEVNPLIVLPAGFGCQAVDLLVVRATADSRRPARIPAALAEETPWR